jgi:type I restriction enzyme M protein
MNNTQFDTIKAEKVISQAHDVLWNDNSFAIIPTIINLEREYNNLKNLAFNPTWNIKEQVVKLLLEYYPNPNPKLAEAYEILSNCFDTVTSDQVKEVIRILTELPIGSYSDNEFSELFFLSLKYNQFTKRSGEITTPVNVLKLMSSIYDLNVGSKVYNPFGGYASFVNYLQGDINYYGEENNSVTWALGILNLNSQKKIKSYNFKLENSIDQWNNDNFDLTISNPPFSSKINNRELTSQNLDLESLIIDKFLKKSEKKGKAIFLMPLSFLFSGKTTTSRLRKELVERKALEYVIELPAGIFEPYTGIASVIIAFNENPSRSGGTTFINAKNFLQQENKKTKILDADSLLNLIKNDSESLSKRWVSYKEISLNDFNLNVNRYFVEEIIDNSNQLVALSEICTPIIRGGEIKEGTEGCFVRIRDLKNDVLDNLIENDSLDHELIPKHAFVLKEHALLLALRGNLLKPTSIGVKETENSPIFISNDILALSINEEKVNISYLIFQLHSEVVQKQIEAFRDGVAVKSISKKDLLQIKIELPPIEKQQAIALELIQNELFPKEIERKEEIQKIKAEFLEDLRIKKHNISQHLNDVKSSISALIKFMEKSNGILQSADLISVNRQITVKEHLSMSYDATLRLGALLEKITNDEKFDLPEVLNIDIALRKLKDSYFKETFELDYFYDEQTFISDKNIDNQEDYYLPLVKISESDLRELFYNIVENADNHGFKDNSKKHLLKIEVSFNPKKEMINILFSNNGKAFPLGMDEKRYLLKGEKAGVNGNTGYGGYRIKSITEHYKGNLKISSDEKLEFPVSILLNFPITTISDEI